VWSEGGEWTRGGGLAAEACGPRTARGGWGAGAGARYTPRASSANTCHVRSRARRRGGQREKAGSGSCTPGCVCVCVCVCVRECVRAAMKMKAKMLGMQCEMIPGGYYFLI